MHYLSLIDKLTRADFSKVRSNMPYHTLKKQAHMSVTVRCECLHGGFIDLGKSCTLRDELYDARQNAVQLLMQGPLEVSAA